MDKKRELERLESILAQLRNADQSLRAAISSIQAYERLSGDAYGKMALLSHLELLLGFPPLAKSRSTVADLVVKYVDEMGKIHAAILEEESCPPFEPEPDEMGEEEREAIYQLGWNDALASVKATEEKYQISPVEKQAMYQQGWKAAQASYEATLRLAKQQERLEGWKEGWKAAEEHIQGEEVEKIVGYYEQPQQEEHRLEAEDKKETLPGQLLRKLQEHELYSELHKMAQETDWEEAAEAVVREGKPQVKKDAYDQWAESQAKERNPDGSLGYGYKGLLLTATEISQHGIFELVKNKIAPSTKDWVQLPNSVYVCSQMRKDGGASPETEFLAQVINGQWVITRTGYPDGATYRAI